MHTHRTSPTLFLRLMLALLSGALIGLFTTPAARAQVDRAVLEGTVTDPSGSVIAGASVKVRAVDTGLTQEQPTNPKGYYRFPGLAVGNYQVTASGTGFKTKVLEDVVLLSARRARSMWNWQSERSLNRSR